MREGHIMGVYEEEQRRIAEGTAQRGQAALDYFAELDARLVDENGIPVEESLLAHRPDYSKTLFALENDDIYQEFCRFLDQPEPRYFDTLDNQIEIEGYTAKAYYKCDGAWVVTNSSYTEGARQQAEPCAVRLIDGDELAVMEARAKTRTWLPAVLTLAAVALVTVLLVMGSKA